MKLVRKTISLEPLKSRMPNLLNSINEKGEFQLTSLPNGSWGRIMPNIIVPETVSLTHTYDTIIGGKIYGYRRLMDLYHTILKETYWHKDMDKSNYVRFIEELNSIHRIDKTLFPKSCDIPDVIHSVSLEDYIQYLTDIKNEITLLQQKEVNTLTLTEKRRLYHTIKRFKRKGGVKFIEYLKSLPSTEQCKELSNQFVDMTSYPNITTDIFIGCKDNDMGYSELLLPKWAKGKKYYGGDMVLYNGETYICTCEDGKYSVGVFDSTTGLISFDYDNFTLVKEIPSLINSDSYIGNIHTEEPIEFTTTTHKQLKSLRYNKIWRDVDDTPREPTSENEDWLAYYKVGIIDYNSTKDKYENIEHFGFDPTNGNDLVLYGSGISSITPNEDFTELTIKYFVNTHLIADFKEVKTDEDGRTFYYFENFRLDDDELDANGNVIKEKTEFAKHSNGAIYTEKFIVYRDSDLYRLINGEIPNLTFNEVISNHSYKSPYKFEFYRETEDEILVKKHTKSNKTNYLYGNLIKRDEYIGVALPPNIKEYTDLDRGVTNYAESHMVMGDIFSFEDLVNYNNGGFFKIEKS